MADIFSGWNAVQNAPPMAPPSSMPQIATLGNLVDVLEQRRALREKQAMEEQKYALAVKKQDAINAYHTRRLDQKDAMDRAKHLQQQYDEATKLAGKGQHPGSRIMFDAQGNPVRVDPRFEPAQAPAQVPGQTPDQKPAQGAAQAPAQPLVIPASLEGTNVVAQALDRNPDADSADELGMGPQLTPEEAQAIEAKRQSMLVPWPDGRPMNLEEDVPEEVGLSPDSPEAQAIEAKRARLLQGDPGGTIDLENPPAEKTPAPDLHDPGVETQENEPPHAELMSPEASGKRLDELGVAPLPPKGATPSFMALQDALDSRGSNVPQAEAAQPAAEFKRGKWVYDIPGGQPFEIDLEQARQAHLEDVKEKIAQIDAALADPNTLGLRMEDVMDMRRTRAYLLGGLPANDRAALTAQAGKRENQQTKDAGAMDRLDKTLASKEKIAAGHDETALKKAQMSKRRGGSGLARAKASDPTNSANNPWAMLDSKERTREGNRMNRELRDWSNMNGWTKLLSTNVGRLDWANENIALTGPGAGAGQAEAMMNLFGVARGGVPVKNETDEFYKNTRTLKSMLNSIGPSIGIPGLGAKLSLGELTEQEKQQYADGVSSMPEEQRSAIERAIKSTSAALIKYGKNTIGSLKTLWDNEPLANRYKGTSFLNELGAHVGMPPQQWWNDVPLNGGANAPAAQQGTQTPGASKGSIEDAVKKLLGEGK